MSSVAGLFTEDKEQEFKSMLIDTDEVNVMHLNTDNEEFNAMAQAMGITEFPYILVYFNGDRDHNIHGPANLENAVEIINELERIRPKGVTMDQARVAPVDFNNMPETDAQHEAHGPIPEALEAHTGPDG